MGESNYKIRKLNKSEKKLSIASLITEKNNLKDLIVFNDFDKEIKKTKEMNNILINEIYDAYQNRGSAIKKKEDTHKMAESNKVSRIITFFFGYS